MIEPVCRSPWINASALPMNLHFRRETARFSGASGPECGGDVVELRRGPAVVVVDHVGLGEDQVFGDLAERRVAAEDRDARLLLRRARPEVGGEEERPRHVFGHVGGCARVADALDHAAPHDDVGLQQLHRRQHQHGVEMVDRGREARRMAAVLPPAPRARRRRGRAAAASFRRSAARRAAPASRKGPPAGPRTRKTRLRLPSPTSSTCQSEGAPPRRSPSAGTPAR